MSTAVLADAVLVLHFAVVVFVIGGLLAVPLGQRLGWRWVRNPAFRWAHLGAVGLITAQAWLGQHCPLTILEAWLRTQAGQRAGYEASFVQTWLQRILFFEAPLWVFALAYTGFAALVALAWWHLPPRPRAHTRQSTPR